MQLGCTLAQGLHLPSSWADQPFLQVMHLPAAAQLAQLGAVWMQVLQTPLKLTKPSLHLEQLPLGKQVLQSGPAVWAHDLLQGGFG